MNLKAKFSTRPVLSFIVINVILTAAGFLIAFLLSLFLSTSFQDLVTYAGFIIILLGIITSLKGNPFIISFRGMGKSKANADTFDDLMPADAGQGSKSSHKNLHKKATVEFGHIRTSMIVSGILLLLASYYLF